MGYIAMLGQQPIKQKTDTHLLLHVGPYGWYTVWNTTSTTSYTAPKRLELVLFNVPRQKWVYWTSCWPAGRHNVAASHWHCTDLASCSKKRRASRAVSSMGLCC